MLRRFAAVGAPPILLLISAFVLVRYHPMILEVLWGGALPQTWAHLLGHLPLMLAAVGVVGGLRMGSGGIMIIMLTLGTTFAIWPAGGAWGVPPADEMEALPPFALLFISFNYLLGVWTRGHSWRSQRGLTALAAVLICSGLMLYASWGGNAPVSAHLRQWMEGWIELPIDFPRPLRRWEGILPTVLLAIGFVIHAFRKQDPLTAALSASLLVLLPAVSRRVDGVSMGILSSAAVLVVWVGTLESMLALAYRDGLTGLHARRGFNTTLRQLGRRYAIAMLDVDHFKRFNDRFGHRVGDDVLRMMAARLRRIPGGRAFRYGGEEFVVIFRGRSVSRAAERMERFREALARTPFVVRHLPRSSKKSRGGLTARMRSRRKVRITASIGLAIPAKGCRKPSEVLAAADKALYKAKQRGRNRVVSTTKDNSKKGRGKATG